MKTKLKFCIYSFMFLTTIMTTGCGGNSLESIAYKTPQNEGASTPDPEVPTSPTPGPRPEVPEAYQKLELSGKVGGGSYEELGVFSLDKANDFILFSLPINAALAPQIFRTSMDKLSVKTIPTTSFSGQVLVQLPLKHLYGEFSKLQIRGLPNGNVLPMMPQAQLPSLSLDLGDNHATHLYFASGVFGYFLESPNFPATVQMTAPIVNAAGTRTLGYFTVIPKSGTKSGGLFVSLILPTDIGSTIQEYLEYLNY